MNFKTQIGKKFDCMVPGNSYDQLEWAGNKAKITFSGAFGDIFILSSLCFYVKLIGQ